MIFFVYDGKIQEWAPFDLLKRSMQASISLEIRLDFSLINWVSRLPVSHVYCFACVWRLLTYSITRCKSRHTFFVDHTILLHERASWMPYQRAERLVKLRRPKLYSQTTTHVQVQVQDNISCKPPSNVIKQAILRGIKRRVNKEKETKEDRSLS